jgi:hypothetical protein
LPKETLIDIKSTTPRRALKKIHQIPKGVRLEITHFRKVTNNGHEYSTDLLLKDDELLPRGGATLAEAFDRHNNPIASAWANCSQKDNYNKKLGKTIAVGRLLKELNSKRTPQL